MLYLESVLSREDARTLIEHARGQMQRSTVVDAKNASNLLTQSILTSSGMWMQSPQQVAHPTVVKLCGAMSAATQFPLPHFEFVQILRYEPGQYYRHHTDFFDFDMPQMEHGQRIATGIAFLTTVPDGGGGAFRLPYAKPAPFGV